MKLTFIFGSRDNVIVCIFTFLDLLLSMIIPFFHRSFMDVQQHRLRFAASCPWLYSTLTYQHFYDFILCRLSVWCVCDRELRHRRCDTQLGEDVRTSVFTINKRHWCHCPPSPTAYSFLHLCHRRRRQRPCCRRLLSTVVRAACQRTHQ